MTEELVQALILSSVTLAFLISARSLLVKWLGAKGFYRMWWMVPASLVLPLMPESSLPNNDIFKYAVNLESTVNSIDQTLLTNWQAGLIVWGLVAILLTVFLGKGHHSFLRRVDPQPVNAKFKSELHTLTGIEISNLKIFSSCHVTSPFIDGVFRPYLVLPTSFTQDLTAQQCQLILRHELQHLRQGDLQWNFLAQLLLIAFWFNPLAWIAFGNFRVAQEMACDESVLATQNKPTRVLYAKAMLACAQNNTRPYLNIVSYGVKREMKSRLKHIQSLQSSSLSKSLLMIVGCVLALASIQLSFAGHHKTAQNIRPVHRIEPLYPIEAANQGIEGSVVVKLDIEANGSVSNVQVVNAQPKSVFEKNTKIAVQQWRWEPMPGRVEGVLIQLDYLLEGSSQRPSSMNDEHNMEQITVEASAHD